VAASLITTTVRARPSEKLFPRSASSCSARFIYLYVYIQWIMSRCLSFQIHICKYFDHYLVLDVNVRTYMYVIYPGVVNLPLRGVAPEA
jgi:hypothetical protein